METQAGWCAARRVKVSHVPCKPEPWGRMGIEGPVNRRHRDTETQGRGEGEYASSHCTASRGLLQTSFQSHSQFRLMQPSSLTLGSLIASSCPDPPGERMLVCECPGVPSGLLQGL